MKKFKVFLSPLAERKLSILLDYLTKEFGEKSKLNYLSKFTNATNQISNYPESCPVSIQKIGVYKCVVNQQSSFYYRIFEDEIEIITLIDNRQNQTVLLKEMRKYFSGI